MKIRKIIQTAAATLAIAVAVVVPVVGMGSVVEASAPKAVTDGITKTNPGGTTDLTVLIKNVVNILLFIVGVASVIMIIVGGLKYVTSAGDSNGVNSAKNTVLYAVVGLVIASIAYAIVNFVVKQI